MPGAEVAAPPPAATGFFGKIPARGDFVRAGLPRSFTDKWDEWLQAVIAGSQEVLGARWLPAWMEAPIWHFALPAGQCGPAPVLGVWMPSVDAAGRHFPLTLALVGPGPAAPESWLSAAEAVGLDALQHDLAPEEIARRLAPPPPGCAPGGAPEDTVAHWWTEGSPFVPEGRLELAALPDAASFARMLYAGANDAGAEEAGADEGGVQG